MLLRGFVYRRLATQKRCQTEEVSSVCSQAERSGDARAVMCCTSAQCLGSLHTNSDYLGEVVAGALGKDVFSIQLVLLPS